METAKRLRDRINQQRAVLDDLDRLANEIDAVDLVRDNDRLVRENRELEESLAATRTELAAHKEKLSRAREALASQIASERAHVLEISRKRIDALFSNSTVSGESRLSDIERKASREITNLRERISGISSAESEALNAELDALAGKVAGRIAAVRREMEDARQKAQNSTNEEYRALEGTRMDDETIERRVKQNRFEVKIGLNLVNKIGVLLLLLGLGASVQYGYAHFFNEWVKGSFAFLLALVLLFSGELAYRKKSPVFASGLTGGGIAALYGALFYSHFVLDIIPLEAALVISVLVAVSSVALFLRYDSQTVAVISLAGGFLPFFSYSFSFDFSQTVALLAFGYILVLNAILVAISLVKSWRVTGWVSFALCIPCVVFLAGRVDSVPFAIGMFVLSYAVYQASVLVKPLKHRIEPTVSDIVLVSLNSLFVSLAVFTSLGLHGLSGYYGLAAVLFSACFLAQGLLLYRLFSGKSAFTAILLGCALTFSVLAIPFQFGLAWALIGWVCEGVFLSVIGNRYRAKYIEVAGWIVLALTSFLFLVSDLALFMDGRPVDGISVKFASLAIGLYVLAFYYGRYLAESDPRRERDVARFFAWAQAAVCWILILCLVPEWIARAFGRAGLVDSDLVPFFSLMALGIAHIALSYLCQAFPPIRDRYYPHSATFLRIIAGLALFRLNIAARVFPSGEEITALGVLAAAMLVAGNVAYAALLRSMVLAYLKRGLRSLELYPAALAAWLLAGLVSFMTVQFGLGPETVAFTTAVLLFALAAVAYGFVKRFRLIRVSALALVIATLAKFFVYDLSGLSLEFRILSFFGYGIILIAISFLYQRMKIALDGADENGK